MCVTTQIWAVLLFAWKFVTSKFIFIRHFDILFGSPLCTLDRPPQWDYWFWWPHLSRLAQLGLYITSNRYSVRLKLMSVMRGQLFFWSPRSLLALATMEWISVSRERELEMVTPRSFPSEKDFHIQSHPPFFVKCTGFLPECLSGLLIWYTDHSFVLLSAENEVSRVLRSIITVDHTTHPLHTPSFDPQLFVTNVEVKNLFLT